MSLPVPDLDTIAFEELVDEARSLIPRYAPAWTDHNLHDPGITVIELLAWLVDQQIYRIGFVGPSLHHAFAALLGAEITGPSAARGLLWPVEDSILACSVVSKGTTATVIDQPDMTMTLERSVYLSSARLAAIHLVGKAETRTVTRAMIDDDADLVLEPSWQGGPLFIELEFQGPLIDPDNPPGEEALLHLGVSLAPAEPAGRNWGPIAIEHDAGDEAWMPLAVIDDSTEGLAISGVISCRPPINGERSRLRIRLDQGLRPAPVTLQRVALNVCPLIDQHLDNDRHLGVATGLPDQVIDFEHGDILGPMEGFGLTITAPAGSTRWTFVESFLASGPEDRHAVMTDGTIRFGNGVNGKIPPRGEKIVHDPVTRSRGAGGNLPADLAWRLPGAVTRTPHFGINTAPIEGGRDRSSLDELVTAARDKVAARQALLSTDDIERSILAAGLGIERIDILDRALPGLPGVDIAGSRTVVVVPVRLPNRQPRPAPAALLEALSDRLVAGRPLGERLHVVQPIYVPVNLEATILIESDADEASVHQAVNAALASRLNDLQKPHSPPPWPIGLSVTTGELERLMSSVDQVISVLESRISDDEGSSAPISLPTQGIATIGEVALTLVRHVDGALS